MPTQMNSSLIVTHHLMGHGKNEVPRQGMVLYQLYEKEIEPF